MKLKKILLWLLLLLIVLPVNSITGKTPDTHDCLEVSCSLSGKTDKIENKELVITFSDEMVPLGGKRIGKELVQIRPAIEGNFLWRGTRPLVFKPLTRFRYATQYTVQVKQDINSLNNRSLKNKKEWKFNTPLAFPCQYRVESSKHFENLEKIKKIPREVQVNETLYLQFNQPVSVYQLENHLGIWSRDWEQSIPVQIIQNSDKIVRIKPKEILKRGKTYCLQIKKGFKGIEGHIKTDRPFRVDFDTVPPFKYYQEKWQDQWNYKITPDHKQLELRFSNPLIPIKPGYIKILKATSRNFISLSNFNADIHYYDKKKMVITIEEELNSGDRLIIKIDKNLTNIL